MGDSNHKLFNDAMILFLNRDFKDAYEKFFELSQKDSLSGNCAILASLYCCLSRAAIDKKIKNLQDILDLTYDDYDFNHLRTMFLIKFLKDLKEIMISIFDYGKERKRFDDIIKWYNNFAINIEEIDEL